VLKKVLALTLTGLLCHALALGATPPTAPGAEEARAAERVKAGVARLGVGPDARVVVKLRDKTKLKGYIREASEGGFVVVDEKTGAATAVAYPQVGQVKGNNLSTGVKVAITVAIFVLLLALLVRNDT
jgi:hypothetical protein